MKREDKGKPEIQEFTEGEAWSRFERAVDGAAKHGPARHFLPKAKKRLRSGANARRNGSK